MSTPQPIRLPFPIRGLDEYSSVTDQPQQTSADLLNVVAIDPVEGRGRGGQRPSTELHVTSPIDGAAVPYSPIQDTNHITGPNFTAASGANQLVINNPASAAWGLMSAAGALAVSGGTDAHLYQMSTWDRDNNYIVCTRSSSTATTVDFQKFDVTGAAQWTSALSVTHGSSSSSVPPVAGMAVIGPHLFVLFNGSGAYDNAIYRYYVADGTAVDSGAWASKGGNITGDVFETHNANYLAASGGYLGVVTSDGVIGTDASVKLVLDVLNPVTSDVISSTEVQTVSGGPDASDLMNCYGIEGDGAGSFFISGTNYDDSAGSGTQFLEYRTSSGTAETNWSSPITLAIAGPTATQANDIAYDAVNNRLGCVGGDVLGTGFSLVVYDAADQSKDHEKDANSTVTWERIVASSDGGFRLAVNAAGDNIIALNSTITADGDDTDVAWTYDAAESDQDEPLSINTGYAVSLDEDAPRDSRIITVAGGSVYETDGDANTVTAVTSGADALNVAAARVYSTAFFNNIFYADGKSTKYYNSSTKAMTTWTLTAGSLPSATVNQETQRCRLVVSQGARVWLSGLPGDSHNWFASAMTDAFDFDYSPATTCETQAVAGSASDAGKTQDSITSLMPWDNDYLLFGMDHSLGLMMGNPAGGGRIDMLTDITGVVWGRGFSIHPDRSMWFIGSRGGLYRMGAGERLPQRITSTRIDERLADIDLKDMIVEMEWDDRMQGFLIAFTPRDLITATTHYFYDLRNDAWFPWKFAGTRHDPRVLHMFDGDDPNDRVMLLGCGDGYLRKLDYDGTADEDTDASFTAINSYVMIGPLQDAESIPLILNELSAVLDNSSSPVTFTIHVGDSAEEALAAPSSGGGTFTSGKNRSFRIRHKGHAMFIKLTNSANSQTWALERVQAAVSRTSQKFARQF